MQPGASHEGTFEVDNLVSQWWPLVLLMLPLLVGHPTYKGGKELPASC